MKRNLLLFAVAAVAMLYACSKDATTDAEAQPVTPEIAKTEIPTPQTFAKTRQVVADVLGDTVDAKIAPTHRPLSEIHF